MGDLYKCFGWCWGEIGCLTNDRLRDTKKRGVVKDKTIKKQKNSDKT